MKIDIEKLNRKMPYPELSDDFFNQMQAKVISQTVGENPVVLKKETKIFSLNLKWMAAAAVVLIAGMTAFFGFNNDPEVSMAQQTPIIDSVYEIEKPVNRNSSDLLAENSISTGTQSEISTSEHLKSNQSSSIPQSKSKAVSSPNIIDSQEYAAGNKNKSEMDVEKVLAAFTPDQLKDIDRNSEQDVYLDLYN